MTALDESQGWMQEPVGRQHNVRGVTAGRKGASVTTGTRGEYYCYHRQNGGGALMLYPSVRTGG